MSDRTIETADDLDQLTFDSEGLIPVIAQDGGSRRVLMVAWATRDALERALATGGLHYWSRSRGELWRKGATSGNTQRVRSLHADCDGDTVLALVDQTGPACHTGATSCFGDVPVTDGLDALWGTLLNRADASPEQSYTARLLSDENLRVKKLGEETVELVHALAKEDTSRIREEAADLLYHVLVALLAAGVTLQEVLQILERRRNRRPGDG